MKNLLLILVCLFGLSTFAQETQVEVAPNCNVNPDAIPVLDSFNLQFSFPCAAFVGEYGVNTDGNDIYVSQWLDDSIAKYDELGNVLDMFVIPGVAHVRDIAFDGQYYYGSAGGDYFYVMDFDNKVLIDTVTTSFIIRGMAYDPVEDVLWASEHWTPWFYKMDKQGNILDSWLPSGITLDHISGLAYDNVSYGGPSLWGFSQDSTGAIIIKYDIATQSQTGNMIDVSSMGTNSYTIAGGLFIRQMALKSDYIIGGMLQNDLVFALELGYANTLVNIESNEMLPEMEIYPNPVRDVLNIQISAEDTDLSYRIFNQTGQLMLENIIHVDNSSLTSISTAEFSPGLYFVQLNTNKGLSVIRKFIVAE